MMQGVIVCLSCCVLIDIQKLKNRTRALSIKFVPKFEGLTVDKQTSNHLQKVLLELKAPPKSYIHSSYHPVSITMDLALSAQQKKEFCKGLKIAAEITRSKARANILGSADVKTALNDDLRHYMEEPMLRQ
jgi:hypothetical protein